MFTQNIVERYQQAKQGLVNDRKVKAMILP